MKTHTRLLPLALVALAGCMSAPAAEPVAEAAPEEVVASEQAAPVEKSAPAAEEPAPAAEEPAPAAEETPVEEIAATEEAPPEAEDQPAGREPMDMEAIMAAYAAYGKTGPEHDWLKGLAGEWTSESKMWMSPEQPEPTVLAGKLTRTPILGGRYLLEKHEGEFMNQPFEGLAITGFNNLDEQYHTLWIDSWGTGFTLQTGTKNADGVLEMKGVMKDPITPDGRPYRGTMRDVDANTQVFEMFDTGPDGKEWKVAEMTYRRVVKGQ